MIMSGHPWPRQRSFPALHRHAHNFVVCVQQFITNLQHQVERESGLFRFDHDIMQFDRFAGQQRFLRCAGLCLQIIHGIDRVGQQVAEIRLRYRSGRRSVYPSGIA